MRTLLRLIRDRQTLEWPTVQGVIQSSGRSKSFYPTAEIAYIYTINDERYYDVHQRAFFFRNSAEDYAKEFIPERKLTGRYCSEDPRKSFVSGQDQVTPPVWATRYR